MSSMQAEQSCKTPKAGHVCLSDHIICYYNFKIESTLALTVPILQRQHHCSETTHELLAFATQAGKPYAAATYHACTDNVYSCKPSQVEDCLSVCLSVCVILFVHACVRVCE